MTPEQCRIIELPKITDPRGNLTFIEQQRQVQFDFRRAYWIYDVPGSKTRGGHAYRTLRELIVAVSGSFEVHVDDGRTRSVFPLNRPYYGVYVPAMWWRSLANFSTNALCLIIASERYDENDYIRDYPTFVRERDGRE